MFTTAQERALLERMDKLDAELSAAYGFWYELFSKVASGDPRKIELDRVRAEFNALHNCTGSVSVTMKDGSEVIYTASVLPDLMRNKDVLAVIDLKTGELLYS